MTADVERGPSQRPQRVRYNLRPWKLRVWHILVVPPVLVVSVSLLWAWRGQQTYNYFRLSSAKYFWTPSAGPVARPPIMIAPPSPTEEGREVARDMARSLVGLNGAFSGRLLDAQGRPIASHVLRLQNAVEWNPFSGSNLQEETDATGHFAFHDVPPGDWIVTHGGSLRASGGVYSSPWSDPIHVRAGKKTVQDLVTVGPLTITGRIETDAEGLVLFATLTRASNRSDVVASGEIVTWLRDSRSGQFQIAGLVPGDYVLIVCMDTTLRHCLEQTISLREDFVMPNQFLRLSDF